VWLAERRRAIAAGLEGLPAEQRQAVKLAYLGGLTHVEIAARQGAPLSTVKTRLALGLRKLAAHLRAERMGAEDETPLTAKAMHPSATSPLSPDQIDGGDGAVWAGGVGSRGRAGIPDAWEGR
jgi:hypothetical protein